MINKKVKNNNKTITKKRIKSPFGYATIQKWTRFFTSKPLLKKILFTLLLILIFRIGATITTPGVRVDNTFARGQGSLLGVMDMMGGGALKKFSIFALGISPFITASIIMTLLQSEVFPPLYRLSQSGPAGKRKINIITRVLTLIFAMIQAVTIIQTVGNGGALHLSPSIDNAWFKFLVLPMILMAGSLFVMFLGEQITQNGVGNGTSLIIFSGIASSLPAKFRNAYKELTGGKVGGGTFTGVMEFIMYALVFVILIFIIGYLYKAERHVPIQQVGSGMTRDIKQMSRLPIKLNPAGVMPVIFSLTIAMLPLTVAQFLGRWDPARIWMEGHLRLTQPIGLTIMILVNFLFTIVMSLVTFNPNRVADNFKKGGTFIPGVKPGLETENYLTGIIIRLGTFSAIYLSFLVSVQYIEQIIGLSAGITFSGTSLIIMVTVAVETIAQLKARNKTGNITKAKIKSNQALHGSSNKTGGLLW